MALKISIIIPVYNSEKYLKKCLDSVLNQTIDDFEVICIDDGSTDGSLSILQKYAQEYNNLRVLSQSNQGQGKARNFAISQANGEYIGFVDSDDYVDWDYFEKLYSTAKEYNADIALASILKHKSFYKRYNVLYKAVISAETIQKKIELSADAKKGFFYAWNKIYKTDLVKNNDIKFSEGQLFEDVMFAMKALYYSNRVVSVPDIKYHYLEHKTSTVKHKDTTGKKQNDFVKAYIELQKFCKENEIILPERLNYHTVVWYIPFVKTYIGQYKAKDMLFGLFTIKKKRIAYDYPVDLVYLWVNGNDPEWKKKKMYWQEKEGQSVDSQSVADERFIDNDELKYSLRSVEKYCSWINKIYIVTDNQVPEWLDTNNPKVEVVFHKDFIPEKNLPLFNSEAIETYLPYLPGLSEHFLYGNDDMLFGGYVNKQFFYDADDRVIVRLKHQVSRKSIKTSMYRQKILAMQNKIKNRFKKYYPNAPHHNIDAYKKSEFIKCINEFKSEFEIAGTHKFREEKDIQRTVIGYYMLANGSGRVKYYSRIWNWISPLNVLKNIFTNNIQVDSIVLNSEHNNYKYLLSKYKPKLFCINDDESMTSDDRQNMKIFMQRVFNKPSQFEKEAE